MSEERAGTSQEIADALFGGGSSKPDNRALVDAAHPPDPQEGDALTSNQARAANEYGLPNAVAERLRGADYDEVSADARTLSDALKDQTEGDVPDHVKLARAAIEAARNNPNAGELMALGRKKRGHSALIDAVHPDERKGE